jgi:hypothetical protein
MLVLQFYILVFYIAAVLQPYTVEYSYSFHI